MSRRALTRHTARHRGLAAVPAAQLIAAHMPPGTRDFAISDDTAELFLPGLHPALAAR